MYLQATADLKAWPLKFRTQPPPVRRALPPLLSALCFNGALTRSKMRLTFVFFKRILAQRWRRCFPLYARSARPLALKAVRIRNSRGPFFEVLHRATHLETRLLNNISANAGIRYPKSGVAYTALRRAFAAAKYLMTTTWMLRIMCYSYSRDGEETAGYFDIIIS